MEFSKASRFKVILFPQSTGGRSALYLLFLIYLPYATMRELQTTPGANIRQTYDLFIMLAVLLTAFSGYVGQFIFIIPVRALLLFTKVISVPEGGPKTGFLKTLIACIIGTQIFAAAIIFANRSLNPHTAENPASEHGLTANEQQRFQEIIKDVIRGEHPISKETHVEFQLLLLKAGVDSPERVNAVRAQLVGISNEYQKLIWEDARDAYAKRAPIKSSKRYAYEKKLLAAGSITEERIKKNEAFIQGVASRAPFENDGSKQMVTPEIIASVLSGLNEATSRLDKLFAPIPSEPQ